MLEIAGLPDRFKLKEKLGSGGMAVVYLAYDSELGHDIALKKLQIEVATNFQNAFERFRREFTLLSSLSHPNLIKTYELLFTAQQEPFVWSTSKGHRSPRLSERAHSPMRKN